MAMPMPAPDRSRNAVLAAAVVIALLAVVGLVVLLLGGFDDDEDRLASTAPTASATPTGSASASPTPSPAGPTAAPPEAAPWEVDAAFVTPEAASAAEERGFSVSTEEGEPGPLLDPCGDGDFPLAGAIAASNERVLSSTREAGGSGLAQEVFRYATEQDAAAALAAYLERVERCPTGPTDVADHTIERTLVPDASDEARLLVRERYCGPECSDIATTYALVVRAADGLSVLSYGIGEDGDPEDGARPLLDAAAEALQSAVSG